jgi:hypothetical protein
MAIKTSTNEPTTTAVTVKIGGESGSSSTVSRLDSYGREEFECSSIILFHHIFS